MDIDALLAKVTDETLRGELAAGFEALKAKPSDPPELATLRAETKRLQALAKTLEKQAADTSAERDAIRAAHHKSLIAAELSAASAGARDPSDVLAYLGAGAVVEDGKVVVVGADGTKTDAKTAVAGLLASKPHLAKPAAPDGGSGGSGIKRGDIGGGGGEKPKMTYDEYQKLGEKEASDFWDRGGELIS